MEEFSKETEKEEETNKEEKFDNLNEIMEGDSFSNSTNKDS
jgi:hypothetical protein